MTEEFNFREEIRKLEGHPANKDFKRIEHIEKKFDDFIKRLKDYIKYAKWWQAKSRMELYNEIDKLAGEKLTSASKEGGKGK